MNNVLELKDGDKISLLRFVEQPVIIEQKS